MAQKITDRILAEYDQIRTREGALRNKRMDEAHKKYPELMEIKKAITEAGVRLASEIGKAPLDAEKLKSAYDKEVTKLLCKRAKILSDAGIPDDYDKIHYECELCEDTGYVDNKKCRCFISKKIKYAYENSNLSEQMKDCTFDKFSLEYYSDEPDSDGISHRMRAEKALGGAKSMAERFDSYEKNLLFFGNLGLGKTFLSGCIANSLISQGYSVLYMRSGTLFNLLENKKFNKESGENDRDMIESIYSCDLLIIDDLGTELPSKFRASFLYDIISERILHGKKLVINTNLSTDEMSNLYTARIVSRLFESFYVCRLTGYDIRKQKANGK